MNAATTINPAAEEKSLKRQLRAARATNWILFWVLIWILTLNILFAATAFSVVKRMHFFALPTSAAAAPEPAAVPRSWRLAEGSRSVTPASMVATSGAKVCSSPSRRSNF